MNAVIGLAHLLLKGELSGKQRDYISRIHGAAKMLLGVINDVPDFPKIEAGQMKLEKWNSPPATFSTRFQRAVASRPGKGLNSQYVVEPGVPAQLLGDRCAWPRSWSTSSAMRSGTTPPAARSVYVRRLPDDSSTASIRLEFAESTIRASACQQNSSRICSQAFQPGQTPRFPQIGGTGLGLAVSKRLSELMGGDIRVTARPASAAPQLHDQSSGRAARPQPPCMAPPIAPWSSMTARWPAAFSSACSKSRLFGRRR